MHLLYLAAVLQLGRADTSSAVPRKVRPDESPFRMTFDATFDFKKPGMINEKQQRILMAACQRISVWLGRAINLSTIQRPINFAKVQIVEGRRLTRGDFPGRDFIAEVRIRNLEDGVVARSHATAYDSTGRAIKGYIEVNPTAVPQEVSQLQEFYEKLRYDLCAGFGIYLDGEKAHFVARETSDGAVLLEDAADLGKTLSEAFKVNTNGWIGIGISLGCLFVFIFLGCWCQRRANRKFQKQQSGIKAEREKRRRQVLKRKRAQEKRKKAQSKRKP